MSATAEQDDAQRKRLLWRATHRGIKEMDIIIGGYAQAHLAHMSAQDVSEFERLLDIPDQDLLSWLTGQAQIPDIQNSALLQSVLSYRPSN